MPYIPQDQRQTIDDIAETMVNKLVLPNGRLNYLLCKYFKMLNDQNMCNSYNEMKAFLAELHEAEEEIRRRFLVPHEEQKMKDNGDI